MRNGCWCMMPRVHAWHRDDLDKLLAITATSKIGGILAAPVRDTMKRGEPGKGLIAHTVDREDLWHALTPQLFPLELLRSCCARWMKVPPLPMKPQPLNIVASIQN